MKTINNYFILDKTPPTLRSTLFSLIKLPFALPSWIASFLLARNIANVTLNPTEIKKQRPIHLIYFSDNPTEKGQAVINLLSHDPHKTWHDYLLKFSGTVMHLPFISGIKKHELRFNHPKDKAHIDKLIEEIRHLIKGTSTAPKCENKTFNWNEIHFKGLEFLDEQLRTYFFAELSKKQPPIKVDPHQSNLDFFSIETADDAVLDSIALSAANEKSKPMSERKFIIACLARDQNYINWIKDFNYSAEQIGCTIIGFNYRGVDYSKGMVWTQENMINDALAEVDRLLALGAKPENIGLEGMCLGGAIATIAAARLHEQGQHVKLYNERSFRSIPRFINGYLLPEANSSLLNPINWLRYSLVLISTIIVIPLICLAGWWMDAGSAWDKIPASDKNYSVIRNPHDADPKAPKVDGVVEDSWASIASLMDEKREKIIETQQHGKTLSEEESVLLSDVPKTHYFKANAEDLHGKAPHHLARRHLMQTSSDVPCHMHQHMITHFKTLFGLSSTQMSAGMTPKSTCSSSLGV